MADNDVAGAFVRVSPDLEEFKAELDAGIREAMAGSGETAKIGADTTEAKAKIDEINAELSAWGRRMGAASADVDTARAQAKLDEISVKLDEFGHKRETATADVKTDSGTAGMGSLLGLIAALGPVAVAAVATAAGSLAVLPALFGGIGLAAGAVGIGFQGISTAVKDMATAQAGGAQASAQAALTELSNAQSVQSAQNAVRSSVEALANAEQQASRDRITAAQAVASAQQSLGDAERQQANDRISQDESLATAESNLATTRTNAAQSVTTAIQGVASAEQSLQNAEYNEQQAQMALVQARQQAADQLINLKDQLADSNLSIQQAQLDVQKAQAQMQADAANPAVSQLQRQQDQLTYEQSVQHLQDLQDQNAQLSQQQQQASAAGVDGAQSVQNAQHNLTQAVQGVASAQQSLANAQAALTKAQVDGAAQIAAAEQHVGDVMRQNAAQEISDAERVANAQRGVADALRNQSDQAASDAQRIADAQRGVSQAQQSLAATQERVALSTQAASGTAQKYATDLANLSPAARSFVEYVQSSLMPFWHQLQGADQQALFPGLEAGLKDLMPVLQAIEPFLLTSAKGIGQWVQDVASAMSSPQGLGAIETVLNEANTLMGDFGQAVISFGSGFANLGAQAQPIVDALGKGIDHIAASFADWTTDGGSQRFLAFIQQVGPEVVQIVENLARDFGGLAKGLGILAPIELPIINDILKFLGGVINANPALAGLVVQVVGLGYELHQWGPLASIMDRVGKALFNMTVMPIKAFLVEMATGLWEAAAAATGLDTVPLVALLVGIGLALAALVVGIIELVKHWGEVWREVQQIASDVWGWIQVAIDPVIHLFEAGGPLHSVLVFIQGYWDTTWGLIRGTFQVTWDVIKTIFDVVVGAFETAFKVFVDLITGNWSGAWDAIKGYFSQVWSDLQTVAVGVWTTFSGFFTGEWSLFEGVASKAWSAITGAITSVWDGLSSGASKLWSDIKGFFVTGVNDVIDVLNFFIGVLDDVLGFFHLPTISKISHWTTSGGTPGVSGSGAAGATAAGTGTHAGYMAAGGAVGGPRGSDTVPAWLTPGEFVISKTAVDAIGAPFLHMLNAQRFGIGGIVNDIGGGLGDVVGAVGGVIKKGAGEVAKGALDAGELAVRPLLAALPDGMVRQLGQAVYNSIDQGVRSLVGGGGSSGSAGSAPTGDHLSLIDAALKATGTALTGSNEKAVNLIISNESSWDTAAVNRTDSNWLAGHPSVGLMQVIQSTFREWAGPYATTGPFSYGVSTDPFANLYAGIRYAMDRYGDLSSVPGVKAVAGGGSYVGYDTGGWLAPGGAAAVNLGSRPEAVLTPDESMALVGLARSAAAGRSVAPNVRVYIGDRELTDMVRVEVDGVLGQVADEL